jgi:4-amino-4-deoxy-L-arabinose transferase-like glycosyltransferase
VIHPGEPTAFRAPGFPLVLALLYWYSYSNYLLAYLLFCLLGAATAVATYCLARELLPESLARVSGFLLAVYFGHVYFATIFLSEGLFALCVALSLWAFLIHLRTASFVSLLWAGLLFGYAALTRPIAMLFCPFLVFVLWRSVGRISKLFLLRTTLLCAAWACVVLPWTARNVAVFHKLVSITTNGGATFYGGNNDIVLHDRAFLGSWISTTKLPGRPLIDAQPDEVSHDQMEWRLGFRWVRSHWSQMPLLFCYKLARFIMPAVESKNKNFVLLESVTYLPYGLLIFFGVGACWRMRRTYSGSRWLAMHAFVLGNLTSALIFYGSARFRNAIAPVLMIYAAVGLQWIATLTLKSGGWNAPGWFLPPREEFPHRRQ